MCADSARRGQRLAARATGDIKHPSAGLHTEMLSMAAVAGSIQLAMTAFHFPPGSGALPLCTDISLLHCLPLLRKMSTMFPAVHAMETVPACAF